MPQRCECQGLGVLDITVEVAHQSSLISPNSILQFSETLQEVKSYLSYLLTDLALFNDYYGWL
jgi:hypothetical protein